MNQPSQEALDAIRSDEFARAAIEAARAIIYAQNRDWGYVSRSGKILFENDEARIAYCALSHLLGTEEAPSLQGGKVHIGGGAMMPADAVDMLQAAFAKK